LMASEAQSVADHLNEVLAHAARDLATITGLRAHIMTEARNADLAGDPTSATIYKVLEALPRLPAAATWIAVDPHAAELARAEWAARATTLETPHSEAK
jgi:hypothetical protein